MKTSLYIRIALLILAVALLLHATNGMPPAFLFLLMNGIVIATAFCIANRYCLELQRRTFIEAVFLFYIAEIILVEIFLGTLGLLNIPSILIAIGIIFITVISVIKKPACKYHRPDTQIPQFPMLRLLSTPIWITALFFMAVIIAQAIIIPPHSWDSLTYHVHFPITWLKEGGLSIIPTPFGDSSVAYVPCNGELFFLWLILPFREDFLVNLGQLPFLIIGAFSLFGIARTIGISRLISSWACLLFISTPAVIAQIANPYVDIIFTSLFLLSVEFLLLYWKKEKKIMLVLLATSLGLLYGIKSLAIPYGLLILFPLAFVPFRRFGCIAQRLLIPLVGIVTLGGFWYIRNLIVTGNPTYPLTVDILGHTIFPGMFDWAAQLQGYGHITSFADAVTPLRMIFGTPLVWLILCSIPLSAYAALTKKRRSLATIYTFSLPFLSTITFQFLTPAHTPWRFLLIVVPFCILFPAYVTTINRSFKYLAGYAIAVCLLVTIWQNIYLTDMAKFVCITAFGLGQGGIRPARPTIIWTLITVILFLVYLALYDKKIFRRVFSPLAIIAAGVTLATASNYFSNDSYKYLYWPNRPYTYVSGFSLNNSWGYEPNRGAKEQAWLFLDRNVEDANIAWAGVNIPGALYGTGLKNNVTYVNINSHTDWKQHDYDIFYRSQKGYRPPQTMKPAYYRREADFISWLNNLRKKNIDCLFVTQLSPWEVEYLRHDREGFPIENIWAEQHPEVFSLLYRNPQVRIYLVKKGPERSS